MVNGGFIRLFDPKSLVTLISIWIVFRLRQQIQRSIVLDPILELFCRGLPAMLLVKTEFFCLTLFALITNFGLVMIFSF